MSGVPYPPEAIAANELRKQCMAQLYLLYLNDYAAAEQWDRVADYAEHLCKCLRSVYDPDGPLPAPATPPTPQRIPRRASQRVIEVD